MQSAIALMTKGVALGGPGGWSSRSSPTQCQTTEPEGKNRHTDDHDDVDPAPNADVSPRGHPREGVVGVGQRESVGNRLEHRCHLVPRDEQAAEEQLREDE